MYKNCIKEAFANGENNSLNKVCTDIANTAKRANFPNGKLNRMFFCALIPLSSYIFTPMFKDEQGIYIEYSLKGNHICVIKDCFLDTAENG